MIWLASIAAFVVGFGVGNTLRKMAFESQDWALLKWSSDIFGYRIVPPGGKIHRNDKVIMALEVVTEEFPDEGIRIE